LNAIKKKKIPACNVLIYKNKMKMKKKTCNFAGCKEMNRITPNADKCNLEMLQMHISATRDEIVGKYTNTHTQHFFSSLEFYFSTFSLLHFRLSLILHQFKDFSY
jgi:hypothetical protein